MGIDVYLTWKGQTKKEMEAQYTGFSIVDGHVGYLREAYHGGPYATKVLVPEGWRDDLPEDDSEHGIRIPAVELKKRLPLTVMTTLFRHHLVYGEGLDPSIIELGDLPKDTTPEDAMRSEAVIAKLKDIFTNQINNKDHEGLRVTEEQARQIEEKVKARELPDYALAFADFVALAERMEAKTGEPCRVIVSA